MSHLIHQGDSAQILKQYPDNHFDSVVTDPPYGIEFLGKDWDKNTGAIEIWRECLRVLKPGGFLLAFSAARTYHHLATNIESVGFEIRDQLMWIYASGFPKAQDIGKAIDKRNGMKLEKVEFSIDEMTKVEDFIYKHNKTHKIYRRLPNINGDRLAKSMESENYKNNLYEEVYEKNNEWSGWKTALKPAHEPIVMARKPFKGSTIDNVLKHGTGALNIDASRIAYEDDKDIKSAQGFKGKQGTQVFENFNPEKTDKKYANDETLGMPNDQGRFPSNVLGEIPDYQKYFYCPKVTRRERHCGFEQDHIPDPLANYSQGDVKNHPLWDPSIGTNLQRLKHKILEHNRDLGKKDPLAHIPAPFGDVKGAYQDGERFAAVHQRLQLGDSAPRGERRCSKNAHERWHQGMEHKKGGRPDPLAHITHPDFSRKKDENGNPVKENSSWMYDKGGVEKIKKAIDPLAHIEKPFQVETQFDIHKRQDGVKNAMIKQAENTTKNVGNNHPTVKPVALMRYLIQLVTPADGSVLDPFTGSGSTGMAACELGHRFVGCELDPNYVRIANKRITGWLQQNTSDNTQQNTQFDQLFEQD